MQRIESVNFRQIVAYFKRLLDYNLFNLFKKYKYKINNYLTSTLTLIRVFII